MRTLLTAALLSVLSLIAGAAALILAEFGAPVWLLAGLVTWLVTIGLPTLVSVLLLARFWPGPSFQTFVLSAIVLACLFQFAALAGLRWILARRRRSVQP